MSRRGREANDWYTLRELLVVWATGRHPSRLRLALRRLRGRGPDPTAGPRRGGVGDGMPRCPECDGLTEHEIGCSRMDRV